jgi:hypothetical protein
MDWDDWNDLPEDKSEAFAWVVRRSSKKLDKRLVELRSEASDTDDWSPVHDAQYDFMTSMIGVAKNWEVPNFADYEIPDAYNFSAQWNRRFHSDLNHFLAQIAAGQVTRRRELSVGLDDKTKSNIRGYIHGLKGLIDTSHLSDARKAALLKKLTAFERELDGQRVSLIAVSLIAIELMGHPGAVWQSAELAHKLVSNMITALGEGKAAEDDARAAALPAPQIKITASPRYAEPAPVMVRESYDLNDDIPF